MDTYGEQTVEIISTSVLSLVMENWWQRVPGALRQIDGGQERVYGVNAGGNVYTRNVDGSGSWRHIPGRRMKQITASGVHEVFAVDANKKLYRCQEIDAGNHASVNGKRWTVTSPKSKRAFMVSMA